MGSFIKIPGYADLLKDQYDIIEDLTPQKEQGKKTYLAFFASETLCARVILKELDEKRTALYEILQGTWNPYTASTLYIHKLPSDPGEKAPRSIAAIEYAGDLSLAQYVRQRGALSEEASLSVCVQLCRALAKMHSLGIFHRDIKPENVIVSDPSDFSVKLIDFGSATIRPKGRSSEKDKERQLLYADTTVVGSLGYQAPESLTGRSSARSDIYSIGCLLNFMLTGCDPGIERYHKRPAIRYILRKSTNTDPSMRFRSVDELERVCRHELCAGFSNRIPLLRSLPGFRSHTRWKAVTASFYYVLMAFELTVLFRQYPIHNFISTTVFWVLIPLFLIGNIGYTSEYLPAFILYNNLVFNLLRAATFLVCLFVPLLFY